ncbi:unnamed protein product [Porites evermanni]|uniref:Uncharacterized protein n=1 Tax=Porites evermanni TaxID=104178 RepID=A0ABN8LLS0_9CNID|nr:unnamed protein product [Porites evermanni]
MNMSNLAKTWVKLPVVLQIKWNDEALRIRERKVFPTLEDLVEFFERRAEAANDPVFGRDLEIADVDDEQVTMLIGEHVPEAQVHEKRAEERDQ